MASSEAGEQTGRVKPGVEFQQVRASESRPDGGRQEPLPTEETAAEVADPLLDSLGQSGGSYPRFARSQRSDSSGVSPRRFA